MLQNLTPINFYGSLFALIPLAATVTSAQTAMSSRSTSVIVGVTNDPYPYIGGLSSDSSDVGAPVTASTNTSFTGKDRNGNVQTMNFNGRVTASAQYGQLHCYATGTVTNSYYNSTNPKYYDFSTETYNPQGSPDSMASLGFATFTDTLQYGGALQAGYKARYIFHVDGTNSGYGALADLDVKIGSDADEAFFAADVGSISTTWATIDHAINGTTPQSIYAQFSDQFVLDPQDVADGSTISGTSDFGATVTLEQILIVDADGNPVSGVTVSSDSGTVYSTTPEPATLGLLLMAVPLLRRRPV